jgi:hypothetical protein
MRSVFLCVLPAAFLFTVCLAIDKGTSVIASSEAGEVGGTVSERELRRLFPGQFRAIATVLLHA